LIHQLDPPLPVTITAKALPAGVQSKSRRGWCYGWQSVGIDGHRLWIVAMDDTGEVIDFPQPEIRLDPNWSIGRR
jgi:hypothetical protein